jgi:hypothetical protein
MDKAGRRPACARNQHGVSESHREAGDRLIVNATGPTVWATDRICIELRMMATDRMRIEPRMERHREIVN